MSAGPLANPLASVDRQRLHEFLGTVAPTGADLSIEILSGGLSNLTYLVGTGKHIYVVRRGPLGSFPRGTHDMSREFRVQAALAHSAVPVATMFGFSDDPSIIGAPFYVMSVIDGRVIQRPDDVDDLSTDQARTLCSDLVDVLVHLHSVDVAAAGLADLGRPAGFVRRHIGRWLDQWGRVEHRDLPLVDSLGEYLLDNVPAHADETLVHGDYRMGNVVVDIRPGGIPAVTGVLDWELSTLGDPLTDLAHLLIYWESARGRKTHVAQDIATRPGFLDGATLAKTYSVRANRSIDGLDFYLVFEHWRAAIIKEGIYQRHLQGLQLGAEGSGQAVLGYLDEAADLAGLAS